MASIFILGQEGDAELWLVDTAAGTVQPLTGESSKSLEPDFIERIQAIRGNGFEIFKNVNVAIAASGASDLTSREFSQNG